jgi:hypothetical protein
LLCLANNHQLYKYKHCGVVLAWLGCTLWCALTFPLCRWGGIRSQCRDQQKAPKRLAYAHCSLVGTRVQHSPLSTRLSGLRVPLAVSGMPRTVSYASCVYRTWDDLVRLPVRLVNVMEVLMVLVLVIRDYAALVGMNPGHPTIHTWLPLF